MGGRGEQGQAVVLTALLTVALLGAAALSVDFGRALAEQFRLQNATDAAALAGASQLPFDCPGAAALAQEVAARNGVDPVSLPSACGTRITVVAHRDVPTLFARALGILQVPVAAASRAQAGAAVPTCAGGSCGPAAPAGSPAGQSSSSAGGPTPSASGEAAPASSSRGAASSTASAGGSAAGRTSSPSSAPAASQTAPARSAAAASASGSSPAASSTGSTAEGEGEGGQPSESGDAEGSSPLQAWVSVDGADATSGCSGELADGGCVAPAPGQFGLVPWDVSAQVVQTYLGPQGCAWQDACPPTALLVGAGEETEGNFGALALGGTGAARYRTNIEDGAAVAVRIGEEVETESGDLHGPTCQAVEERLAAGADYVLVPVVATPAQGGRSAVQVLGFAAFHLVGADCGSANSPAQVEGSFVAAAVPSLAVTAPAAAKDTFGLFGLSIAHLVAP